MPTGTTVEKVYKALHREGMDEGKAAQDSSKRARPWRRAGRPSIR